MDKMKGHDKMIGRKGQGRKTKTGLGQDIRAG
jgi:hypothetical protein